MCDLRQLTSLIALRVRWDHNPCQAAKIQCDETQKRPYVTSSGPGKRASRMPRILEAPPLTWGGSKPASAIHLPRLQVTHDRWGRKVLEPVLRAPTLRGGVVPVFYLAALLPLDGSPFTNPATEGQGLNSAGRAAPTGRLSILPEG